MRKTEALWLEYAYQLSKSGVGRLGLLEPRLGDGFYTIIGTDERLVLLRRVLI
jgi:hypothetical protein